MNQIRRFGVFLFLCGIISSIQASQKIEIINSKTPECAKTLVKLVNDTNRLVFRFDNEPLFSDNELKQLAQIYTDAAQKDPHRRKASPGEAITLLNPFEFELNLWRLKERWIESSRPKRGRNNLYKLMSKFGNKVLSHLSESSPNFINEFDKQEINLRFFSVRYFPKRGHKLGGVPWHQHGEDVLYQGIILLQKPEDLIGGAFLLTEGLNHQKRVPFPQGGGISITWEFEKTDNTIWKFELPINRVLTFEGRHTGHATEDFELPLNRSGEEGVRDILGLEISYKFLGTPPSQRWNLLKRLWSRR